MYTLDYSTTCNLQSENTMTTIEVQTTLFEKKLAPGVYLTDISVPRLRKIRSQLLECPVKVLYERQYQTDRLTLAVSPHVSSQVLSTPAVDDVRMMSVRSVKETAKALHKVVLCRREPWHAFASHARDLRQVVDMQRTIFDMAMPKTKLVIESCRTAYPSVCQLYHRVYIVSCLGDAGTDADIDGCQSMHIDLIEKVVK